MVLKVGSVTHYLFLFYYCDVINKPTDWKKSTNSMVVFQNKFPDNAEIVINSYRI